MIGETWEFTKTFSVEDTKKHCEFYEEYNKVHWDIDFVKKYTQYENVIVPGMMIQNFFVRIQKKHHQDIDNGASAVLRNIDVKFFDAAYVDSPITFKGKILKERIAKIGFIEFEIIASQNDKKIASGILKVMKFNEDKK